MKTLRHCGLALVIFCLALSVSCGKKVVQSAATPYTAYERPKAMETGPEIKPEASSSDQQAALDKEREQKLREEALREEDLKARALKEEAARREAAAREGAKLKDFSLETVYFDYNEHAIKDDNKEKMAKNADWLKAHPQVKIALEGHCDERGTAEYNLALGQKRAEAVKAFILGLGIPENRLQTVSYGFERPTDKGHNEAAWAKNRRVEFTRQK
jgi:peptidoglycan-associated lipoprotein